MSKPWKIYELKSLWEYLAYIHRFISNLTRWCLLFNWLMKKVVPLEWDEAHRNAFKSIEEYLVKPPMLRSPIPSWLLILHITTQEWSLGSLLA